MKIIIMAVFWVFNKKKQWLIEQYLSGNKKFTGIDFMMINHWHACEIFIILSCCEIYPMLNTLQMIIQTVQLLVDI